MNEKKNKITFILSNKTNEDLRKFIAREYPCNTFGMLSYITEYAVACHLRQEGAMSQEMFERKMEWARKKGIKEGHIKMGAGEYYTKIRD